jgi:dolichol-phosphate mannosyltransferase
VIPAYNEEAAIEPCVRAVDEVLRRLPNRSAVIVVNDGSTDRTGAVLDGLERAFPRLVRVERAANGGYGAATRTGTTEAARRQFEYVVFMDSDLTNDPAYLADFADAMAAGVDMIKASRYVAGGGTEGVPGWRVSVSRLGNLVARLLFGLPVRDCTNGFRAVRTSLLASVTLRENGFSLIMEELHRLRPITRSYVEIPIVLRTRADHLRASSFSFGLRAMWIYLKYPLLSAMDRLARR